MDVPGAPSALSPATQLVAQQPDLKAQLQRLVMEALAKRGHTGGHVQKEVYIEAPRERFRKAVCPRPFALLVRLSASLEHSHPIQGLPSGPPNVHSPSCGNPD